jgi:hypothetical protein
VNQTPTPIKYTADSNISNYGIEYLRINSNYYIDDKSVIILQKNENLSVNCYNIEDKKKLRKFNSILEASLSIFYGKKF